MPGFRIFFLGSTIIPRLEPRTVGWEARRLPLSYAMPSPNPSINIFLHFLKSRSPTSPWFPPAPVSPGQWPTDQHRPSLGPFHNPPTFSFSGEPVRDQVKPVLIFCIGTLLSMHQSKAGLVRNCNYEFRHLLPIHYMEYFCQKEFSKLRIWSQVLWMSFKTPEPLNREPWN